MMKTPEKTEAQEREFAHLSIAEMFEDQLLQSILILVQDGICFLSTDRDVLYANPAMRYWYAGGYAIGKKCYEVYHGRSEPCEKCPVLRSIRDKGPAVEELHYEKNGKWMGWQRIFSMPILDSDGNILMLIEYIKDITNEKKSNLSVELLQDQLDSLENVMLQREREQQIKQQQILENVNRSINVVQQYLGKILDPESYRLVSRQLDMVQRAECPKDALAARFDGQELLVARYVAEGYMSKEIADKMNLSKKTVDYYRTNIRKKLNLKAEEDLKTRLRELTGGSREVL